MRILEASTFKKAPENVRELLLKSGVLPVNDIYLLLWQLTTLINLLYGSYGSGKSVVIVDRLIDKALQQKYFRCYFGRKILEDVRGSVYKTIIDRIKDRHLQSSFKYSESPTGNMTIICIANGNEFIPFGANDTESLKSIKDPTDFFCEELNQFTFEDFRFIVSRLRKEGVLLQFWGAFNTDKVYQSHWIRKYLFEGKEFNDLIFRLKCNYTDNLFIDQERYYQQLKLLAGGNMGILNAIANGEWGMIRDGNEYWKQFSETAHVAELEIDTEETIHVSVDSNVNPYVTQTVWQIDKEQQKVKQVHEILCRNPDNNAPKAARRFAKWLHSIGYEGVIMMYGDPSAKSRSTVDENTASFFDKYKAELQKAGFHVIDRVQKSAPQVALRGAFINEIYENKIGGWSIVIDSDCFESIEDYLLVKEDVDGSMKKPKQTDKETQVRYEPHGHISDTKAYFITTVLATEFNQFKSRSKKYFGYAA